jgi:hypothetical protein
MADPSLRSETRYKRAIVRTFFVRFHMLLILTGSCLAGVVASKLLFLAHVTSIPLRHALAVVASYLAFLGLVRLWLAYIRWTPTLSSVDLPLDLPWSGRGGGQTFGGGRGGRFGGAGAQGSWGDTPQPATSSVAGVGAPRASSSTGSRWLSGWGFDVDLDEKALVILLAFAALVLAVLGSGVYMIWNAPSILGDAAFQVALSAGLIRASRRLESMGWVGGVCRRTWIPFAIVFTLAVAFGLVVRAYCPDSPTLRAVVSECLTRRP